MSRIWMHGPQPPIGGGTATELPIDPPAPSVPVVRQRSAAEQLILDLTAVWRDRYARHQAMPLDPGGEAWRAQAAAVSDGWTVIYLLSLLHAHAPATAERAAASLNLPSRDADMLATWVDTWARAVEQGRPLRRFLP